MQGFYGMRLMSRHFGEGTLKEWNGKTVTVKFRDRTVRFWFPKAFECGELTATNKQDGLRVREAIDGWVASLIERLKGPLSARVLSQRELACMVERIGKILRGCYPAEEIEQRLLAYRETLCVSENAPEKKPEREAAEEAETPFRAFLRKYAKLFAVLPLIGMGALGMIFLLAPLGSVAQMLGFGMGSGYDCLKTMSMAFEAGSQIPVILSIVYAGLLIFGALSVFVLPQSFGKMGYDIFGLIISSAAFATGVGQAAWVGTAEASAGAFPVLLIVFGIVFAAFYATLTTLRKMFRTELAVDVGSDCEYKISMLLSSCVTAKPAQSEAAPHAAQAD